MLRCPKCRELMEQQEVSGHYGAKLVLHHCPSCLGLWVDRDVAFAMSSQSALDIEPDIEASDIITEPREVPLFCPRCEVYLKEQSGSELPHGLRIDYCSTCHGFWFDKGELMIYKTFLEDKRKQRQEKAFEREAKEKERKKQLEQMKKSMKTEAASWNSIGVGYYPGLHLARLLVDLWRVLR